LLTIWVEELPDVPTVFNRVDFIGILSPGYVAALLWIIIYRPDFLTGSKALSYDVISAVIFVIAGPALGLTLIRIHHGITSFIRHYPVLIYKPPEGSWLHKRVQNSWLDKRVQKYYDDKEERVKYARVRLGLTEDTRLELDLPEAFTNFEASVGLALIGIGAYGILVHLLMNSPLIPWYLLLSLFVGGSLFFVGAWLNYKVYWCPVYNRLKDSLPPE
jgi:hypothetical protein